MKKTITIVAAMLMITFTAKGQKNHFRKFITKSHHSFSQQQSTAGAQSLGATKQKLHTTEFQDWEGSAWLNSEKTTYKYNAKGKVTEENEWEWDEDEKKDINSDRELHTYDGNGNKIAYTRSVYDEDDKTWTVESKSEYKYDSKGNQTEHTTYRWNNNDKKLYKTSKIVQNFDSKNHKIEEINSTWDKGGKYWVLRGRKTFANNSKGKPTEIINFYRGVQQWVQSLKQKYTYNGNGYLTNEEEFSFTGVTWAPQSKTEITVNNAGKILLRLYKQWDFFTSKWITKGKLEKIYNAKGNTTEETEYTWDNTNSIIIPEYKYNYTYQANGDVKEVMDWEWDATATKWNQSFRTIPTYNTNFSFDNLILPFEVDDDDDEVFFNHMLTGFIGKQWDKVTKKWVNEYKGIYSYSAMDIISIKGVQSQQIKAYPNPAVNDITFEIKDNAKDMNVLLVDAQGKIVINKTIKNGEKINVSNFKAGIYFYTLTMDGKVLNGSMVKE